MIRKKISGIFKNEEGAGLVLALMVLVVLAVLGLAVGSVTVGSYKLGDINRDSNSAYYIAEAGANLAYEEIKNGVMNAYEAVGNKDDFYDHEIKDLLDFFEPHKVYGSKYFAPQFGDQPQATVEVNGPQDHAEGKTYTIISTGEVAGKERIVKKEFKVVWLEKGMSGPNLPPDGIAILYRESYAPGGVKVKRGKVLWDAAGDRFDWDAYGPDSDLARSIEENTSDNDDGDIYVTGDFTGDIVVNNGNLIIDSNGKITGNIISRYGKITIKGNPTITGNIISFGENIDDGNIEITKNPKIGGAIISAFGTIKIGKNTDIEGIIIGNKVVFNHNADVYYSENYQINFPFNSDTDGGSGEPVTLDDLISAGPALEP